MKTKVNRIISNKQQSVGAESNLSMTMAEPMEEQMGDIPVQIRKEKELGKQDEVGGTEGLHAKGNKIEKAIAMLGSQCLVVEDLEGKRIFDDERWGKRGSGARRKQRRWIKPNGIELNF